VNYIGSSNKASRFKLKELGQTLRELFRFGKGKGLKSQNIKRIFVKSINFLIQNGNENNTPNSG
jgi:hypothetical protein